MSTHAGHRQRLRDRFQKSGLDGFADYETVELLLTLAIPRSDVKQPAKELIRRFGDLRGILDAPSADLRAVRGIGKVAPVALKIVKAVARLLSSAGTEAGEFLADSSRLRDFCRMRLGVLTNEALEVSRQDASGHIIRDGVKRLSEGATHRAPAYLPRIVEQALKRVKGWPEDRQGTRDTPTLAQTEWPHYGTTVPDLGYGLHSPSHDTARSRPPFRFPRHTTSLRARFRNRSFCLRDMIAKVVMRAS